MQTEHLIAADEFCASHQIEFSFIQSLNKFELIEITTVEEKRFIPESQLQQLEKLVRLHYDLDINLEGIDAITHLLERMKALQEENGALKSKLRLYETNE